MIQLQNIVPIPGSTVWFSDLVRADIVADWPLTQDNCTILINGREPDLNWIQISPVQLRLQVSTERWPGQTYSVTIHVTGQEELTETFYFNTTQNKRTSPQGLTRDPRTQLMANVWPKDSVLREDLASVGNGALWPFGTELGRLFTELHQNRVLPAWADPRIPVLWRAYLKEGLDWQTDYMQGGETSFRFPAIAGYSGITKFTLGPVDGNVLEKLNEVLPTRLGLTILKTGYNDTILPLSVAELGAFEGFTELDLPGHLFVSIQTTQSLFGLINGRYGLGYVHLEGTNLGDYPIQEDLPFAASTTRRTFSQFKTLKSAQFVGPQGITVDLAITNSQPFHAWDLDIQYPMVNSEYSGFTIWDWEIQNNRSFLLQKAFPNVTGDALLRGEAQPGVRYSWQLVDTDGEDLIIEDLKPDLFRPWLYAVTDNRFFIFNKQDDWLGNKEMAEATPDQRYQIGLIFPRDNVLIGEEFQIDIIPVELEKPGLNYVFSVETSTGTTYLSQSGGGVAHTALMNSDVGFKFPTWNLTAQEGKSIFRLDITYVDGTKDKIRRIMWVTKKRPLVEFDLETLGSKRLFVNHRCEPVVITPTNAYRVDLYYDYALVDFYERAVYSAAQIDGMEIVP